MHANKTKLKLNKRGNGLHLFKHCENFESICCAVVPKVLHVNWCVSSKSSNAKQKTKQSKKKKKAKAHREPPLSISSVSYSVRRQNPTSPLRISEEDPGLFPQMSDPKSQIWAQNVRGFWYKKCPYADRVGPGGPKNVLFSDICSKKSQKFSKNSQTSF